jgi:hypothetical protein
VWSWVKTLTILKVLPENAPRVQRIESLSRRVKLTRKLLFSLLLELLHTLIRISMEVRLAKIRTLKMKIIQDYHL